VKLTSLRVDVANWTLPPVFKWLKRAGNVSASEMGRTFNTGVGMVAVVSKENAAQVISELEAAGEKVYTIGTLVPRSGKGCVLKNLQSWE
jgi:phosphoribosylamine--glycine ligase / phosphoribosylformylglycinamidine cyclo-ligase